MDEIDANISGEPCLGLFLGPMWDGMFKSEGYTNKINPCIWIFACTKPLSILRDLIKGRDFLSRINGPTIDIDFLQNNQREDIHKIEKDEDKRIKKLVELISTTSDKDRDDKRTEIVYQTVNQIYKLHGPLNEIENDVLELFYNILPLNGIRSLQIFASQFRNIENGTIRIQNVPVLNNNKELKKQIRFIKDVSQLTNKDKSQRKNDIIKIKYKL